MADWKFKINKQINKQKPKNVSATDSLKSTELDYIKIKKFCLLKVTVKSF